MRAYPYYSSMSKLIYIKKAETKKKAFSKPLELNYTLLTIFIVLSVSSLITFGFIYWGYTSGDYSETYLRCKDAVLKDVRIGTYQSIDDIMSGLKTCDSA